MVARALIVLASAIMLVNLTSAGINRHALAGLMRSRYNSNSRRPWESNLRGSNRGLSTDNYNSKPWQPKETSTDSDEDKPCIGLCYTMKLLKMAEKQVEQEAAAEQANERRKRFDGYLYDFY